MVVGWLLALFGLTGCTTTIPAGMGGVEWTLAQGTLKEPSLVIKEASYIFGEALVPLRWLETGATRSRLGVSIEYAAPPA